MMDDANMMKWEQLLSLKRFGDSHKRIRTEQDETRLGFEVDYDRVIFSSDFRSLQDKTQVIPLSKTGFVHTRLTHSLEVSVVGRSLGRLVGRGVLERHPYLHTTLGYQPNDFGAIIAAASLAHDVGNPPFGHSGELAIGEFFSQGLGTRFKPLLSADEYKDLCKFEGNANGFRILNRSRPGMDGGLRLSYATLGAFSKYPKGSLPLVLDGHVAHKKYGYFQTEKKLFEEITKELGLSSFHKEENGIYLRHPLTYLVEAADDICYTLIDFEDGINLGWVPEEYALEYLINLVKDSINTNRYTSLKNRADRLSYLRALSINTLIEEAARIFLENETKLLLGGLEKPILAYSRFSAQVKDIIKLSVEKIYQSQEVLEKEIAGYKMLQKLLEVFCGAVMVEDNDGATHYNRWILQLFQGDKPGSTLSPYEKLLEVCCFVAGLTDSRAVALYQLIEGSSIKL